MPFIWIAPLPKSITEAELTALYGLVIERVATAMNCKPHAIIPIPIIEPIERPEDPEHPRLVYAKVDTGFIHDKPAAEREGIELSTNMAAAEAVIEALGGKCSVEAFSGDLNPKTKVLIKASSPKSSS